ncbi:MAG: LysM peptidoglycan-binding domain-containing protein [Aggregatilineales bacterium]
MYKRFMRWCKQSVWERMLVHFSADPDLENGMIDSTIVRAHPCAAGAELQYADMAIHIFAEDDTAYSVSRQYNVCVTDLLNANPPLVGSMLTGLPTFIPNTRPCYDSETGMSLIYEDVNGSPLEEPQVSERLTFFGGQSLLRLSSYYNVCANRIWDANQNKFDPEDGYLGWIIPTDRPPCYDQDGEPIDYVCYDQPIDFSRDYRNVAETLTFNVDGTHCYDLDNPETIIWYNNQPYKMLDYGNKLFESRAFTAWCFAVSLEEMNAINNNADVVAILPSYARIIPLPTRDCYLQQAEVQAGQALHIVASGETLVSIANQYDKSPRWIAGVNGIENNMIWVGQSLIIPHGTSLTKLWGFIYVLNSMAFIILSLRTAYWHKVRRKREKESFNRISIQKNSR